MDVIKRLAKKKGTVYVHKSRVSILQHLTSSQQWNIDTIMRNTINGVHAGLTEELLPAH